MPRWRCSKESYSLQYLQNFVIPPLSLVKASLPSRHTMISWSSVCLLLMALTMYVMVASLGWSSISSFCMINHCCLITMNSPKSQILPLHNRYKLKIDVLLFYLLRTAMKIHLPIPEGSWPLWSIVEKSRIKELIAVPPLFWGRFPR